MTVLHTAVINNYNYRMQPFQINSFNFTVASKYPNVSQICKYFLFFIKNFDLNREI